MRALLTGAGNMGRAISAALEARGDSVVAMVGRSGGPDPRSLAPVDVAFEFSHAARFVDNLRYAAAAGAQNVVVGTTGWSGNPATVSAADGLIAECGLRVIVGPTFSLGVVLFTEVAEEAARRFGRFPEFDA